MENQWPEIPDLSWDLPLDERQILQREQDHFGFIVIGGSTENGEALGRVVNGIHIGRDRVPAPDIKLRVIGPSTFKEWRVHALFNFGPLALPEFDLFAPTVRYIVRAVAE